MKNINKDIIAKMYIEMGELNICISEGTVEENVWKKEEN